VYNFGDIWSRNLRVYDVNNSTFCGDTAKTVLRLGRNLTIVALGTLSFRNELNIAIISVHLIEIW